MNGARHFFSRLLGDATANVLPLSAVALLLSAALIGSGIDMGRAWRVENRLQSACDAAVLAGRRAVGSNGFDTAARQQATIYFNTNFNEAGLEARDTVFDPDSEENGNIINATASTTIDTAVMKMFGFADFDLSVSCTASMGVGNSDVVMVLDTTGSMDSGLNGSTRIAALKNAMKNFYDTVKTATQGSNSRIRYGFVPFSQSVNVGGLLMAADPDYIVDSYSVQSREPVWDKVKTWSSWSVDSSAITYSPEVEGEYEGYNTGSSWSNKSACENNLPTNFNWTDDGNVVRDETYGPSGGDEQTRTVLLSQKQRKIKSGSPTCQRYNNRWYRAVIYIRRTEYATTEEVRTATYTNVFKEWLRKERTFDTSSYKNFQVVTLDDLGSNGTSKQSAIWNGCIEERGTVNTGTFSYSSITGMSPAEAHDLNIDMAPDPADDATKWKPMWNDVAYLRSGPSESTTTSNSSNVGYACPRAARLMAEMDESEFDTYADSLYAQGSTYLDLGLIWGGRLASPDGIFKDNVDVDPENGGEVSRHLIFMTDGDMDPTQTSQTSYGIEQVDRRIGDGSDATAKARHLARFRAVCSAIKDKGIRVWVIAFTTGLSTDLKNCASANSSFTASSSAQLNAAFQEIAKQVGELRITQ